MKSKLLIASLIGILLSSCGKNNSIQIAENTFVYDDKVYKLVDNELTEVADLNAKEIRKFEVLKPKEKTLGSSSLSYVKENATAEINALYRGNILYFKLTINGLSDLKENYNPGKFIIDFEDEFGFILHSTEVSTQDLIGIIGDSGKVERYQYNGKTEMSTDINSEIKSFTVSSTVKGRW
jgi:hypothetical protein